MKDYYEKLEEMDDRLIVAAHHYEMNLEQMRKKQTIESQNLAEMHSAEERELTWRFYDTLSEIMADYKEAIDYDIAEREKNEEQFLAFLLELCYYINISKTADRYTEDKMNTLIAASGGKINHEMFQHFLMMVGLIFVLPPTIFLSLRAVYYRITGGK